MSGRTAVIHPSILQPSGCRRRWRSQALKVARGLTQILGKGTPEVCPQPSLFQGFTARFRPTQSPDKDRRRQQRGPPAPPAVPRPPDVAILAVQGRDVCRAHGCNAAAAAVWHCSRKYRVSSRGRRQDETCRCAPSRCTTTPPLLSGVCCIASVCTNSRGVFVLSVLFICACLPCAVFFGQLS